MERAQDGRIYVVTDTCVLINFMRVDRLDLLCRHRDYRVMITEHVRGEVTDPRQASDLASAVSAGEIEETAVTDPAEIALYASLNAFLGRGESASIAVAARRNWTVATDEGHRTRREILNRLGEGRLVTTPGILLKCILNGDLTTAEADAIKARLAAHRFIMNFASFSDILPKPPSK